MFNDDKVRRWPIAIVAMFLCFVLVSLRPVHQLKPTPPPEFSALPVPLGMNRQHWREQYWQRGRFVQWHYSYTQKLPEEPTEEFHIDEETMVPDNIAWQTRRAYWNELRKVWVTPAAWNVSYSIDFGWTRRAIERGADASVDLVKGLWHSFRE